MTPEEIEAAIRALAGLERDAWDCEAQAGAAARTAEAARDIAERNKAEIRTLIESLAAHLTAHKRSEGI